MHIYLKIKICSWTAAIPLSLASISVYAQSSLELPAIEVYGSRVSETLEGTQTSVGIVNEQAIEQRGLTEFRDAFNNLGNVMDADWVDAGFIIRGVNSDGLTPGGAPLASFYIDGIQQTTNGARRGARGVWDAQQIEVYRGPQSTLSGRAALAGAVYLKTKDPVFKQEGAVQVGAGEDQQRSGAVMVNAPFPGNEVAVRLAAEYRKKDTDLNYPDYKSFNNFNDFAIDEYYQVRAKVLYLPADMPDTDILFTASSSYDSPTSDDIGGPVLGFEYDDQRGDFNTPIFTEQREVKVHNIGLEVVHELSMLTTLTSQTTFSNTDLSRDSVNAGTLGQTNVLFGSQDETIAAQELRLNYDDGEHSGVVGVYAAIDKSDANFLRPAFFGPGRRDESDNSTNTNNAAIFGELSYQFVPAWHAIAGARLDYTKSDINTQFIRTRGGVVTGNEFDTEVNETTWLPKIGLVHDLTSRQSVSAIVQRGFRAGGAGQQRSTGEIYEFDAEFTTNYELGYRGRFLQDNLTLQANLFYTQWDDQQVEQQDDPTDFTSSKVVNAAESETKGFEIEVGYQATSALSTFLSVGFVDTEFKEFDSVSLGDLSGTEFPEAPKWNGSVGAFYEAENGLFVGGDISYTHDYVARFGQSPQDNIDSRTLVNARAGYKYGDYKVAVFANNLLDKEYFVYEDNDIAASLGDRRFVGIEATAMF